MYLIRDAKEYLDKKNIDIAPVIVLAGILMSMFFTYAWVLSILLVYL